jgi:hypothetical protein
MEEFMRAAIEEAKLGLQEGGIPIGSVLVQNDKMIHLHMPRLSAFVMQGASVHMPIWFFSVLSCPVTFVLVRLCNLESKKLL